MQASNSSNASKEPCSDSNCVHATGRQSKRFPTVLIMTLMIVSSMVYTLPAPFYPVVATEKGLSQIQYGLVIGIYELAVCLFCFLAERYMSATGPNHSLRFGNILLSVSSTLFGCLMYLPGPDVFLTLSFILRIIEAFGQVLISTASLCIVQFLFPNQTITAIGWVETCMGFGMIIGPLVGGVFFDVGNFLTPFLVTGCVLLLLYITSLCFGRIEMEENTIDASQSQLRSYVDILKIPKVWIGIVFNVLVTSCNFGFLQATLEEHLRPYNLSQTVIGLVFLLSGLGYSICTPLWGYFCDSGVSPTALIVLGALISITGVGMVGPIPWTTENPVLALVFLGTLIAGIGMGGNSTPTLRQMLDACSQSGIPDTLLTKNIVNSLWLTGFTFGGFVGPSLGGFLSSQFGFRLASFLVLCVYIMFTVALIPIALTDVARKRKETK